MNFDFVVFYGILFKEKNLQVELILYFVSIYFINFALYRPVCKIKLKDDVLMNSLFIFQQISPSHLHSGDINQFLFVNRLKIMELIDLQKCVN